MRALGLRTIGTLGPLLLLIACVAPSTPNANLTASPGQVHFTDVAGEVGLDFQHSAFHWGVTADPVAMMGSGLCWLDYDQDGWLDLFVVNSYVELEAGQWEAEGGLPRAALFRNVNGQFTEVSQASGANLPLRGAGCVAADLNQDGWPDLYVTTARFAALLWNNGDGTFSEGARAAGVEAYGWHTAATVGDLNGDGWPDLFVAGYVDLNNRNPNATVGFPNTHLGRPDLLFINQGRDAHGQATFSEVSEKLNAATLGELEYGLGALFTDLDDDVDLDLYVANDTNPNRLYRNDPWPGGRAADPTGIGFRFTEIGGAAHVDDNKSGMGVAGGDYNADGRFDLFVTNMGWQENSVYLNQSAENGLRFQDMRDDSGNVQLGGRWTGWGATWADFDRDTDLDLLYVNGRIPVIDLKADAEVAQVFGNLTAQGQIGQFEDWTQASGLAQVGPLLGRGAAAADYDNDGDLDVAINSVGSPLVLLRNENNANHWLTVQLDGFYPGAVITAVLPGGGELRREIHAGSSYLSSEDPRGVFGVGLVDKITEIKVRWPNGHETRLTDPPINQISVIQP